MYKVMDLACRTAYQTSYYNLTGVQLNQRIPFTNQPVHLKKLRDFFLKNPVFKTFLNGIDKKDERFFMNEIKCQAFTSGDRLVKNASRDRSIYIVLEGKLMGMAGFDYYVSPSGKEPLVYLPGAIIGAK